MSLGYMDHVQSAHGSQKNKGKTIFDLVTMSDIAYTVAVFENGQDKWDESKNGSDGNEESPKKPKFSKRGGIKGQYTTTG